MNVVEILLRQSEERPRQPAIIHGNRQISFGELSTQSARGAAYLRSLGIGKGDRALILVPMSVDLYVILLSLWQLGAEAMFVDPGQGRKHLANCCELSKPRCFIGVGKAQVLRWATPRLREIPLAISTSFFPFCRGWQRGQKFDPLRQLTSVDPQDGALLTFTSGSTGRPKATVRTHALLRAQCEVLSKTLALQAGQVDCATLPVFALINLACGVTTMIPDVDLHRPGAVDADRVLKEIEEIGPATLVASPAFLERLVDADDPSALACLRAVYTGGGPVFPGLLGQLQAALPNGSAVAVYGSTEAEPIAEIAHSQISHDDLRHMAEGGGLLAGVPIDDIDCRVLSDQWGEPLGALSGEEFASLCRTELEVGEVVVSGDHVLKGYLEGVGDEENKFSVDGRVWHRTGDLARFDAEGRLWLQGRCSAKIERNGAATLYPFTVEAAAMRRSDVKRAALCRLGDAIVLVLESTLDQSNLSDELAPLVDRFQLDRCLKVPEIPMDRRHHAKVDYPALQAVLERVK